MSISRYAMLCIISSVPLSNIHATPDLLGKAMCQNYYDLSEAIFRSAKYGLAAASAIMFAGYLHGDISPSHMSVIDNETIKAGMFLVGLEIATKRSLDYWTHKKAARVKRLKHSIERENIEEMREALKHVDPLSVNIELHYASSMGQYDVVNELLNHHGTNPDYTSADYTALSKACYRNHRSIACRLLQKGATPPYSNDKQLKVYNAQAKRCLDDAVHRYAATLKHPLAATGIPEDIEETIINMLVGSDINTQRVKAISKEIKQLHEEIEYIGLS